jgi:EmrB/QacA subfamily drug resistance transporter
VSETSASTGRPPGTAAAEPGSRRWLILGLVGLAQLMIVLDLTVMNIALPDAQVALHFSNVDRQWVITAYALTFGSLLLIGGRLGDLFGRKLTFIIGLVGFSVASAVGGASVSLAMLVAARASQGVFGALLAPAALSILTVTFSDPEERGRAFAVFGAIVGAGGLIGLLLGGALTQYLDWRWCLYVNLVFAALALAGALFLLPWQKGRGGARLDIPGVVSVSAAMFCLVYGFSNAATHSWRADSTLGFLAAGVVLLAFFAFWQTRAPSPLLPPRVVLNRNRGGSYLTILIAGAGMFGIFLFLTYYLQTTLHYSPLVTGVAFLPMIAALAGCAQLSNIVLMPRIGPKALVGAGMLIAAAGMAWMTRIGVHTSYASAVLGPMLVTGAGLGLTIPSAINTGTFGVQPSDAGVASATINTGQQIGGSIGTALLNTIATGAIASYIAGPGRRPTRPPRTPPAAAVAATKAAAAVHGYTTAFWWTAAIFAGGGIICGMILRWGPLTRQPQARQPDGRAGQRQMPAAAQAQGEPGQGG